MARLERNSCRRCGALYSYDPSIGNIYCPRCAAKMADEREAALAKQRRQVNNYVVEEDWSDKIFAMVPLQLIILGAIIFFLIPLLAGKFTLFAVLGFVLSLAFFVVNLYLVIKPFKKMSNALAYFLITVVAVFELGVCFVIFCSNDVNIVSTLQESTKQETTTNVSNSKESSQKVPAYLSGVDNISTNKELGDFYFSIANKFYHNEMGLKGTQEQIDAGNKLMIRVYDFLGTSARKEMLNVDSMRVFIVNFEGVSDFRKKRALKDLQMGIRKIESLNE